MLNKLFSMNKCHSLPNGKIFSIFCLLKMPKEEKTVSKIRVKSNQEFFLSLNNSSQTHQGSISPTCLHTAFMRADHKSAKKTVKSSVFFVLLGSAHAIATCKTLVKSTTGVICQSFKCSFYTG